MIGVHGLTSPTPPNFYTKIDYTINEAHIQYFTSRDKSCSGDFAGSAQVICDFSGEANFIFDCDPEFQFWDGHLSSVGCPSSSIAPLGGIPACGPFLSCVDSGDTTVTASLNGTCFDSGNLGLACGVYGQPSGVSQLWSPPCVAGGGISPGEDVKMTAGGGVVIISNPDTEDAAVTRLQGCIGWTSWNTASPTACLARYQVRTTGVFNHQDAQWQVSKTGLIPSHTYTVAVTMQRSIYGAGSYSLYTTDSVPATTDGTGAFVVSGDVPNDPGFDTYADTVTITP